MRQDALLSKNSLKKIGHFEYLFVALILSTLIKPFFKGFVGIQILTNLLLTFVFLAAIFTVVRTRKIFYISLAVVIPAITTTWAAYFFPFFSIIVISDIFSLIFFVYTIFLMLIYLLRQERITRNVIMCAMSAYFMMGFMWSTAYFLLETISPGSFNLVNSKDMASELIYFSFVTLTTLGYGDITPLSAQARSLVVVETVIGQMYVAILIARLVGIQTTQTAGKK